LRRNSWNRTLSSHCGKCAEFSNHTNSFLDAMRLMKYRSATSTGAIRSWRPSAKKTGTSTRGTVSLRFTDRRSA
jgi:hypothetical protein